MLARAGAGASLEEEAQALQAAVSLYRGAFLEGLSLNDSDLFEAWVLHHREALERQVRLRSSAWQSSVRSAVIMPKPRFGSNIYSTWSRGERRCIGS